jgi:CRISPR-associated protein, csn1 family
MNKYIIGIDLGINNVGWSIINSETKEIEKCGVRLFSPSEKADERRGYRAARRLKKRKKNREEDILKILNKINFPNKSIDSTLIYKRNKGLSQQIEKQDITNIICYYATHRGYIPFGDEERELVDLQGKLACQHYLNLYENSGQYRALNEVVDHNEIVREYDEIIKEQIKYYPELKEVSDKIKEIISRKRKFWEGPGSIKSFTKYGRFKNKEDVRLYKESGNEKYLYEELIKKCQIYINEKVVSKSNYYYEEYKLLNDFINTKIKDIEDITRQDCIEEVENRKGTEKLYKLNLKGLELIIDYCKNNLNLRWDSIYKKLFNITKENLVGYRINKTSEPDFSTLNTYRKVKKCFKEFDSTWIDNIDEYNEIIHILATAPGIIEIRKMIEKSEIIKYLFSEEEYKKLKDLKGKLVKDQSLTYGEFSEKGLKRAINDMKNLLENYQYVSKKYNYQEEMNEYIVKEYKDTDGILKLPTQFVDEIIASPQVKKSLKQAIKVINAIIDEKEDYPEVIAIESTKEMNTKEKAKELTLEQALNEKRRVKAKEELERYFDDEYITEINIEKAMLYMELDGRCPYCNQAFKGGMNSIINSNLEIEHILPISKTKDDGYNNKTLSCNKCNAEKKDRSPYQWKKNNFKEFSNRINNLKISDDKKKHFLEERDLNLYSIKFIQRNLRDTAYGTKELVNQIHMFNKIIKDRLNNVEPIKTLSTPGQLTSNIRKKYNISKDRDEKFHHAVDASIVASIAATSYIGKKIIESQNDKKFWLDEDKKKALEELEIRNVKISTVEKLKAINSDNDIYKSNQVSKDPYKSFQKSPNISKYLKINDIYYKVSQINNIYEPNASEIKNLKKILGESKELHSMIEDNNKKMYNLLKEIFKTYGEMTEKNNPFANYCIEINGIQKEEFDYKKHGIKQENGPLIKKLRYYSKVNNPELINKKNIDKKDNTYIGLDGVGQYCTKIYWDRNNNEFIFMPIYLTSIDLSTKKINKNSSTYKYYYNTYLKGKNYQFITDVYNGDLIEVEKKDTIIKNYVSCYHKGAHNCIELKNKGSFNVSDKAFKIIDTDYLGNEKIRLTWPKK